MSVPQNELIADLHLALQRKEFVLFYQPLFNLTQSTCDGVEALIRWQHPKKGILLPEEFIPVADQSDLIVDIGEWVLRNACLQIKHWQNKGLNPLRMAVNISGRQLKHNFVDFVIGVLQEIDLKPQYLELELNEHIIIHDELLIDIIHRLSKLGIQIALDDFGTGYASASNLKHIHVDRIKIDKHFVKNLHLNQGESFVRSTIQLAKELNVQVIAEGIETLDQKKMLLSFMCNEGQGSYLSEPLSAEEVEKFLIVHQNSISF